MARTAFCSNCVAFLLYPQHHSQAGSGRFGECRRRAPAAGTDNRFRGHTTWPSGPGGMVGPSGRVPNAFETDCRGRAGRRAGRLYGGGPPVTSMPPTPAPAPTPTPAPTPVDDPEPATEPRGAITALGIDRIPLSAIKRTNREIARMFAVIEPVVINEEVKIVSGVRWIIHADQVLAVACHSYTHSLMRRISFI